MYEFAHSALWMYSQPLICDVIRACQLINICIVSTDFSMTNDTVLENTLFLSMNMTNRCYLGNNNLIHLFSAKTGKL